MKKISIGILSGFICGMFASGGGLILVPAFIYLLHLDEKLARINSICCIAPLVCISFFLYLQNNLIDWKIGIEAAVGGIIGAGVGAKLLNKVPDTILKIILISLMLYAAIHILIK